MVVKVEGEPCLCDSCAQQTLGFFISAPQDLGSPPAPPIHPLFQEATWAGHRAVVLNCPHLGSF